MTTQVTLDTTAMLAEAGHPVDPDAHYQQGLHRLADALRAEARLHPQGSAAVHASLVSALRMRAAVDRLHAQVPQVGAVPVHRPIFVTGLLRSGTTLVQNLLTEHPALRAPALWELMLPVSEPGADARTLADRAQGYVDEYYRVAPLLRSMHFLDANRPDECHRLTGNAFASMVYGMRYRVPSYDRWLDETGMVEAYRDHRRQLQAILWRRPGRQVVLKCPFHLWHLRDLVQVYPDARIVVLHRDPAVTVASTCLLCETVRGARTATIDRHEIGRQWSTAVGTGLRRYARDRTALPPTVQLIEADYPALVRDPIAVLRDICDQLGIGLAAPAEAAMRRYLANHPQYSTGAYRYRAEDYGLDPARLAREFAAFHRP
ncbi:sulfotransferase [Micromonospora fiedleri]|uniref:Sulfotransferase n=1 Tax=Micromonospora fiedleri TaxID=1157498 RepID=A0ABS1UVR5_9ACTN|nr:MULTISPECIES: sulfotransferase [Micromonospora]MBL6279743.1 sulfotransferase [Micromonospora fiedleri]WSK40958.1 sulfotransferase [Micromonospora maris]